MYVENFVSSMENIAVSAFCRHGASTGVTNLGMCDSFKFSIGCYPF